MCSLFGAVDLLSRCGTPVYMEIPVSSSSQISQQQDRWLQMVVTFFRSGLHSQQYSLFQQQNDSDQGRVTIGLLALPKDRAFSFRRFFTSKGSTLTFLSEEEWEEPPHTASEGGETEPATVWLADLTISSSADLTALPKSLLTLVLTWPLSTVPIDDREEEAEVEVEMEGEDADWVDEDGQRMLVLRAVSLRCSLWISQVMAALFPPDKVMTMPAKRASWIHECSLFLQVRPIISSCKTSTSESRWCLCSGDCCSCKT